MALVKTLLRKRVNLSFQPKEYELLTRLAEVQGKKRTQVLEELFHELRPVLEKTVAILEAAQKAQQESKAVLRSAVEKSEAVVESHMAAALGQYDWLLQQATHKADETQGRDAAASAGEQSEQRGRRRSRVKHAPGATVKGQKARKRARGK